VHLKSRRKKKKKPWLGLEHAVKLSTPSGTKWIYLFTMIESTGEGRACIPVGPTRTWDGLLNWTKCDWKVEKTLTGPGQPQTCSHPIYAQMSARWSGNLFFLFSCTYICIHRTLESDLLSLSTASGTLSFYYDGINCFVLLFSLYHEIHFVDKFFKCKCRVTVPVYGNSAWFLISRLRPCMDTKVILIGKCRWDAEKINVHKMIINAWWLPILLHIR